MELPYFETVSKLWNPLIVALLMPLSATLRTDNWTTACKWDSVIPFEPMWEQLKRIIKPNGAILLNASQPFTSALIMSNPDMFRYEIIWQKERPTNFMMWNKQILKYHENICVFYKEQPTYNPILEEKPPENKRKNKPRKMTNAVYWITEWEKYEERTAVWWMKDFNYPHSIQFFSMERGLHPTQKPVALIEYLIKTYSLEGDIILDFTSGSWTTWIAAQNTNRQFILIEKDKNYYDISLKRLQENQERLDLLDNCI